MATSLYFAYGSNLHLRQFARRCPGASAVGRARLPAHRLSFTRYSTKRKGGVADIVPEEGATVWGALYEVEEHHLASLDEYEGVPRSYRRETIVVLDDAETEREAWVYIANQTGAFAPSRQYLGIIVSGARDHGLPEEYIAALEGQRTYA
jgi:gamma-glutamylcyclotransferase (GGCT)/AIG2-like uncharacterized protein YtfP